MKLKQSNPFLRSDIGRKAGVWISAKTSSAVEGIRAPFAQGPDAERPETFEALVAYWKYRAAKVKS